MHVGLNLVYLVPGETGGTETYARQLIPSLLEARPDLRLTAFVNREAATTNDAPWGLIPSVVVPVNARNRIQWVRGEQQLLPPLAAKCGVDLLHSLANTAPAWGRFRRVVTIHDLNYKLVKDAHLGVLGLGMRFLVPLAARRSHRIIADASRTRDDLERLLGVRSGKVDVVPLGMGARRAAPQPDAEVRANFNLDHRKVVLSVSAKRPSKNLERLIGALALIPAERRPILVVPGYRTSYEEVLVQRAQALGVAADLRLLGWIAPEALEGLYATAACFVFPSLYEGFGLPVLEAMARDVPVACSGRGALAEVAGDAALYFDPESEQSMAGAIERLLSDPREANKLRVAGRERASQFTWQATATGTLASYERVLSLGCSGEAGST